MEERNGSLYQEQSALIHVYQKVLVSAPPFRSNMHTELLSYCGSRFPQEKVKLTAKIPTALTTLLFSGDETVSQALPHIGWFLLLGFPDGIMPIFAEEGWPEDAAARLGGITL